jgi:hypothetical protein
VNKRVAAGVCAALILIFAALAWSAVRMKSATVDEPAHALAGWLWTHEGDYRFDFEDPPLWGYWLSIPNGRNALHIDKTDPAWNTIARTHWTQTPWWMRTLRDTPGNDDVALVNRARPMALIIAIALGAMIAFYAWRLSGPLAATIAACLFALDPNFLGHAALVKNDIAITLIFLALSYALWRAGPRLTWKNALALALLTGIAMSVKFSGLLALPIVTIVLLIRAFLPSVAGTPGQKLLATACVFAVTLFISFTVIWASYRFRYRAIPDRDQPLNIRLQAALVIKQRIRSHDPSLRPTAEQLASTPPGFLLNTILALNDKYLLPEAWLNGLLFTWHASLIRPAYLLGEIRYNGWWYYFPLAFVFKTPLATMALIALAIALAVRGCRSLDRWSALCLLLPPALYFAIALRTNLNLGLRHVFPVYPPIYIAVACVIADTWNRIKLVRITSVILLVLLAIESVIAWPNYIAFFNRAAGGPRGGFHLLGDSNLDWGQDLPLLARWQREHPDRTVYTRYFGTADPRDYGLTHPLDPLNPQWPDDPNAVLAISASYLQGLQVPDELLPFYESLRKRTPVAVLGGTIFLFERSP